MHNRYLLHFCTCRYIVLRLGSLWFVHTNILRLRSVIFLCVLNCLYLSAHWKIPPGHHHLQRKENDLHTHTRSIHSINQTTSRHCTRDSVLREGTPTMSIEQNSHFRDDCFFCLLADTSLCEPHGIRSGTIALSSVCNNAKWQRESERDEPKRVIPPEHALHISEQQLAVAKRRIASIQ